MLQSELARWVASQTALNEHTRDAAVRVVVDAVAAAIGGCSEKGAIAAKSAAKQTWGDGDSSIWFSGETGSVFAATFANAASTAILDFDDGHRAAVGHPGAAIVPSVLAAAQELEISAERALTAIAIGYEVCIRIAAARDQSDVDTFVSGRWCGQGVAAAIGWMKGYSPEQLEHAMAIAGAVAPYMLVAEYSNLGSDTKEAIPFGATNGMLAGKLAESGFTGPLDILDHSSIDKSFINKRNDDEWYIETTYFKPYSCCRWIHAPIDAILTIRDQIDWQDVIEIEVETFERIFRLNNQIHPEDIKSAIYSTPFCVASAAIHGAECLQPMNASLLNDAMVHDLAEKVHIKVDAELDKMFPASVPGRIRVNTNNQVHVREVLAPKGEPSNPMDWNELIEKLRTISSSKINPSRTEKLIESLVALRDNSILSPLMTQLAQRI